jgi:mRNA interferase MazF
MIVPGSVVWIQFNPVTGREQGGRRPAVVVSSESHLRAATTLITVVPVTSRDRDWPNHIELAGPTGLPQSSFAMTEQVRTVSQDRVAGVAGSLDAECLAEIAEWVRRWLVG